MQIYMDIIKKKQINYFSNIKSDISSLNKLLKLCNN